MSILSGADPHKVAQFVFANRTPIDPTTYADRFRPEDLSLPHTVPATIAFINAMVRGDVKCDYTANDYIICFLEVSPLLRALDERLDVIQAPGQPNSGTTYPEVVCSLVALMTTEDDPHKHLRADVLHRTLAESQTLRANLNNYGYDGMKAGEPGSVWAIRRALSALGGMPTEYYPPVLNELSGRLGRSFPEHKEAITRMAQDYRYVRPPVYQHPAMG